MSLVTISLDRDGKPSGSDAQAWEYCQHLEAGDILFFPETPIRVAAEDLAFLLGQQQTDSSLHKNIAYKPALDALSGMDSKSANAKSVERLRSVMRWYSAATADFLAGFLAPYKARWTLDYASFRPQEEQGRDLARRKRNDLLHTDAFPTRPTHGARILRFFNNIHPTRTRDWVTTDAFSSLVRRFVPQQIALPTPSSGLAGVAKTMARGFGLGAAIPALKRSAYDDFMMRFHNFLKENEAFQSSCEKQPWQFPAGSSWMVYTDSVPHAVLSGQYALEQTFLVAPEAMVSPQTSPLAILESLAGAKLV